MLRKTKLVNFICAIMISIIIMLAIVAVLFVTGVISLGKTNLVISTGGGEAKYDGTPLTNYSWDIDKGVLKAGHELSFKFRGTQTNVGESDNVIEIVITDELGADVTGDYKIEYNFGKLKINPRTVLITYDSNASGNDAKDSFKVSEMYDGLAFGHRIMALPVENVEISDPNAPRWTVAIYDGFGKDVSSNYQIIMNSNIGADEGSSDTDDETQFETEMESSENGENLFEIVADSDATIYLKQQSYGNYNGRGWDEAQTYPVTTGLQPYYLTASTLLANGAQTHSVTISSLCGTYVLPYYTVIGTDHYFQTGDVRIEGDASKPYTIDYVNYNNEIVSQNPALAAVEEEYRRFVYENYLDLLSQETADYMQQIIDAQGFDVNDSDIINKVAKYISEAAEYNLQYDTKLDNSDNIAIDFLENYKEGVCRHYATAATLLYRTLGIPARYTVGVATDVLQNQKVILEQKNLHAWVEVYVDGLGWVCVEVTGSIGGRSVGTGISGGDSGGGSGNGGNRDLSGETPTDVTLYYVTPKKNTFVYLREGSCGEYNGKSWLEAPTFPYLINDIFSPSYLSSFALASGGYAHQNILIEPEYSSFALPYYTDATSDVNTFDIQTSDAYYTGNSDPYTVSYYNAGYSSFKGLSLPDELAEYEQAYRYYVYQQYMNVPDGDLKDYLIDVINQNSFNREDIYTLIEQVAFYIQTCAEYNLEYDRSIDEADDRVLAFLEQKEGVCRHFASAATLMFRLLGVPARYTYGAVGEAAAGERTEIKGDKAHAWVEVYIDGIGWVQVEVTPGQNSTDSDELIIQFKNNKPYKVVYDGEGHSYPFNDTNYVTLRGFEALAELGYRYEFVDIDSYTDAGIYDVSIPEIRFFSSTGEDVTDLILSEYNLSVNKPESLQLIIARPIAIAGGNFEKTYDGKPYDFTGIESPTITHIFPELASDSHVITVTYVCDGVDATRGEQKHQITYIISVRDTITGEDVTPEYEVISHEGCVNILPIAITAKSGSKTMTFSEYQAYKEQNGENAALVCNEITLTYTDDGRTYVLPAGCEWKADFTGELSKKGVVDNKFDNVKIIFTDENGEETDLTYNFDIKMIFGKLKITN